MTKENEIENVEKVPLFTFELDVDSVLSKFGIFSVEYNEDTGHVDFSYECSWDCDDTVDISALKTKQHEAVVSYMSALLDQIIQRESNKQAYTTEENNNASE